MLTVALEQARIGLAEGGIPVGGNECIGRG
jgi:hypothetical protein